ncbi:unnamed protein product [Diamesa tonsa]
MSTKSTDDDHQYKSAKKVKYNFQDLLKFAINLIVACFKITIVAVPEVLKEIKMFFIAPEPKDISGQLAIVTGGSNGLGRDIAMELAKRGCNIAIVDVDLDGGEVTAKDLEREFKVKAKAFKVDVSNYVEVEKLKVDIESSIGTVDILINNAGLMPLVSLCDGSSEDVQKLIDVNLTAHFWTCQIFLKGMIERKRGHIMATCSLLAKVTYPMATVYCATKYGVDGFMNALYDELCVKDQDDFIKLTTAYPNFINTRKDLADMLDKLGDVSPRMTPAYTADAMVKALLQNKRSILIPFSSNFMTLVQVLPDKVMKEAKIISTNIKDFMK